MRTSVGLIILSLVALSYFVSGYVKNVAFAGNDITFTCSGKDCKLLRDLPMFDEHNWLPGSFQKQTIRVVNLRKDTCDLDLSLLNESVIPLEFSNRLFVYLSSGESLLFGEIAENDQPTDNKTIADMINTSYINLGKVVPRSSISIEWGVMFDPSSELELQGSSLEYDFKVSFSCEKDKKDIDSNSKLILETDNDVTIKSGEVLGAQDVNSDNVLYQSILDDFKDINLKTFITAQVITQLIGGVLINAIGKNTFIVLPAKTLIAGGFLALSLINYGLEASSVASFITGILLVLLV